MVFFSALGYLCFKRKIKEKLTLLRYQLELGGEGGYRVGYPGRFKTAEQIIEDCQQLTIGGGGYDVGVPAEKHNDRFDHQIKIYKKNTTGYHIEILESDSQSYLYIKDISFDELQNTIDQIYEQSNNPEKFGYRFIRF